MTSLPVLALSLLTVPLFPMPPRKGSASSSGRACSVDGCEKAAFSRGYCASHHRKVFGAEETKGHAGSSSSSKSSSSSAAASSGASSSSKSKRNAASAAAVAPASLLSAGAVGVDDMVLLPSPSNEGITTNLQARHRADHIYTYIGQGQQASSPYATQNRTADAREKLATKTRCFLIVFVVVFASAVVLPTFVVLVSVNPFKSITGLYSTATIAAYSNHQSHENAPHVFALAETAYKNMKIEEENQCVIIR